MDPFTQRMLERAKARREKLDTQLSNAGHVVKNRSPLKDTNTTLTQATTSSNTLHTKSSCEVSLDSSKSPKKVLSDRIDNECNESLNKENKRNGINSVKSKLQKLGKLYSDDGSRELSSPIHRTEERFNADEDGIEHKSPKRGARLDRLAALASTINNWEDDLSHPTLVKQTSTKAEKIQAKFNEHVKQSELQLGKKANSIKTEKQDKIGNPVKQLKWDKAVLETLELQGFTRTKSNSRLLYDYKDCSQEYNVDQVESSASADAQDDPIKDDADVKRNQTFKNQSESTTNMSQCSNATLTSKNHDHINRIPSEEVKSLGSSGANNSRIKSKCSFGGSPKNGLPLSGSVLSKASMFESKNNDIKGKDPAQMTLSERMALFERNKGQPPLIPKGPLAMSIPQKMLQKKEKSNPLSDPVRSTVNTKTVSAQCAVFEQGGCVRELENDILRTTHMERQRELDIIRSRFNRNKEVAQAAAGSCIRTSESSEGKSNSPKNSPVCPVKPTPAPDHSAVVHPPPPPPPLPTFEYNDSSAIKDTMNQSRHSHIRNQDETESSTETSSTADNREAKASTFDEDTERTTNEGEYHKEDGDINTDSDEEMNTSLGKSILRVVNQQTLFNKKRSMNFDSDSNTSDISVLDEMDEYLDEYLTVQDVSSKDFLKQEGPTPPKLNKAENDSSTSSSSFKYSDWSKYRSPKKCMSPAEISKTEDTCVVEGDNLMPLMHSVSFYRRQQTQTPKTPVRFVSRIQESRSPDADITTYDSDERATLVEQKIKQLLDEVCKQQTIIGQASQALNLCSSTIEFNGSREQVEGERLLLVATHRRQAALNEVQRLKVEGTLKPITPGSPEVQGTGSLIVSAITIPLKPEYFRNISTNTCLHFVCLLRYQENVMATPVVLAEHGDSCIRFPSTLKIPDLYSDFKITVEIYTLQTQAEILPHEIKYHIHNTGNGCSNTTNNVGTKKSTGKTPKKYLKNESRLVMPSVQSPAGPSAVRSPAFSLSGYVVFSLKEVHRQQFTLNKVPQQSPLEGRLQMHVACELSVLVEHRGFLTMFEDVSGFGAWHRRWCLLKGTTLSYWKYPDDERKKTPIGSLELQGVVTRNVGIVSRDICARLHTFLLETVRPAQPGDTDSLVMVKNGSETIIRYLLSADTKEDRLEWCSKLNKTLNLIHDWGGSLAAS